MEVSFVLKQGLRIKAKLSSVQVNPLGKHESAGAILLSGKSASSILDEKNGVTIASVGEYEIGGIKIQGSGQQGNVVYRLLVDNVEILLGRLSSLSASHAKLQESDLLLVDADVSLDPSTITPLGTHAVIFFGDKAEEIVKTFIKENVKVLPKFVTTKEKLPTEMETVLLQ